MKRLRLLRHAKSSWQYFDLSDHDRPLKTRGRKDCELIGLVVAASNLDASHVFSSSATRATETIAKIMSTSQFSSSYRVDPALYTFDYGTLLNWLRVRDDRLLDITIVGHNPALLELHNLLCKEPLDKLPTCSYVQMTLNISRWDAINEHCAEVSSCITPKMLKPVC